MKYQDTEADHFPFNQNLQDGSLEVLKLFIVQEYFFIAVVNGNKNESASTTTTLPPLLSKQLAGLTFTYSQYVKESYLERVTNIIVPQCFVIPVVNGVQHQSKV